MFQIIGLACTVLGAYILVIKHKVVKDPIDFFFDPSCLMCSAGAVTVFVTFFGWMGALREYTCFLRTVCDTVFQYSLKCVSILLQNEHMCLYSIT